MSCRRSQLQSIIQCWLTNIDFRVSNSCCLSDFKIQYLNQGSSRILINKSSMQKQKKTSLVALAAILSMAACRSQLSLVSARSDLIGYPPISLPPFKLTCATILCAPDHTCINARCIPNKDSKCGKYGVDSPQGCLKSCRNDPSFANCDDMAFIAIYDPKFCGWNPSDKTWRSYTFACQACQNKSVIGVKDGKCTCRETGCGKDQTCNKNTGVCEQNPQDGCSNCKDYEFCIKGECVNKCRFAKCSLGFKCFNGNCVPVKEEPKKCSNQDPKKVLCTRRPSPQDCPPVYYFRKPDPLVCGIDSTGGKIDYPRTCEACLEKKTVFYYDTPCDNVPEIICNDNQLCNNGKCIDKCAVIRCSANTTCINGKCVPNLPIDKCANVKCSRGYHCDSGKCISNTPRDPCSLIRCKNGYECKVGKCVPVDECFGRCEDYERCFKGKCLDKCNFLRCANCYKGQCGVIIRDECKQNWDCKFSEKCENGACVDQCSGVKCKFGEQCKAGLCLPSFRKYRFFNQKDNFHQRY